MYINMLIWRYSRTNVIIVRVYLTKGKQKRFINKILSKISVKDAAKICKLSERTIRDWRREKFLMDHKALKILARKTNLRVPSNVKLRDKYWYISKGSSAGGKAVFKKYGRIGGDPEYRKKKWYEWWKREGKYKKHPILNIAKPIRRPPFSKQLAEFVGIVMGDGGITKRQVVITLHDKDDKAYGQFVVSLIKNLFNVPIGTYHRREDSVNNFIVSRSELVRFCTEKLGLKCGNKIKQQIDIPNWIRRNKNYSIACVRGLIDTDGCIFTHKYRSKDKWYSYKKLSFTSFSKPLRQSVFDILKSLSLNPRLAREVDVRLDSIEDMQKYFKLFGSNNPKHLNRYLK